MIGCYSFQFEGSLTGKSITLGNQHLSIVIVVKYVNGRYAYFKVKSHCISKRCLVTNRVSHIPVQSLTVKDR